MEMFDEKRKMIKTLLDAMKQSRGDEVHKMLSSEAPTPEGGMHSSMSMATGGLLSKEQHLQSHNGAESQAHEMAERDKADSYEAGMKMAKGGLLSEEMAEQHKMPMESEEFCAKGGMIRSDMNTHENAPGSVEHSEHMAIDDEKEPIMNNEGDPKIDDEVEHGMGESEDEYNEPAIAALRKKVAKKK